MDLSWLMRLCRRQDRNQIRSVGILSGFFFMINFVVGTGFLSVPYAFYHAGVVSGAITLIILSFISWNTANWVVETMARAQVSFHVRLNLVGWQSPQTANFLYYSL